MRRLYSWVVHGVRTQVLLTKVKTLKYHFVASNFVLTLA